MCSVLHLKIVFYFTIILALAKAFLKYQSSKEKIIVAYYYVFKLRN